MAQKTGSLKRYGAQRDAQERVLLLAVAMVAFLFAACALLGQQTNNPPVDADDPELYFGFFSFQSAVQKDIMKTADHSAAAELRQAIARQLNVSEADLDVLQRVASSTLDAITRLTSDHRTYLSKRDSGWAQTGHERPNDLSGAASGSPENRRRQSTPSDVAGRMAGCALLH